MSAENAETDAEADDHAPTKQRVIAVLYWLEDSAREAGEPILADDIKAVVARHEEAAG